MNGFDGVIRALSDGTRWQVLNELRDEERIQPFSGDGDEADRAIQLHHVHLPMLEDNDLVSWNRATGTVERGENFEAVVPILTTLASRGDTLPDDHFPEAGQTR